jgi:spore coat polysaccharide biosynthesis protein SpsF (cytidylyltransferase family)
MKNGAIILARYDSRRLRGKACIQIAGKRLLEWSITSLFPNPCFDVVLATTERECDDVLCDIAKGNGIAYFRGDTNDVALRTLMCAKHFKFDTFARVNGDSPFVNKKLLLTGFKKMEKSGYDFVTNLVPRTFPYGVAVEIFNTKMFESVYSKFRSLADKEHVTQYFYQNLSDFKYYSMTHCRDDSKIHLVVDRPEDIAHIEALLEKMTNREDIDIDEIVDLVRANKS